VNQVADALLAMGTDLNRAPINLYADLIDGGYPHFKSTLINEAIECLRTAA